MTNILIGLAGAAVLAVLSLIFPAREKDSADGSASLNPALLAIICALIAVIVRLVQLSMLSRSGFIGAEMDEPTRWAMAASWTKDPYFFTFWDGVWLTGGVAYTGVFMKLVGDPIRGMQAANLAAQIFTLGAIAAAGWMVGGRARCGAAAAALASVGFPFIFIGTGPLAEGMMGGTACFTLFASVGFLKPGVARGKRFAFEIATAAGLFATASLHYNGWIAILVAAPLLLAGVWACRREFGKLEWLGVALIVLGAAAFPAAWIFESARVLGSPLAFLHNQTRLNAEHMAGVKATYGDHDPLWVYPRLFWSEAGALIPLLLLAAAPGPRPEPCAARGLRPARLAALAVILLFLIATSLRAKLSGFCPPFHRYLIIPYALSFPAAGAAFATLPSPRALLLDPARRALARRFAASAVVVGFCAFGWGWTGLNFKMARDPQKHLHSITWDHDAISLAAWLQQELRHPQQLTRDESRNLIAFHAADAADEGICNLIAYYSDRRGQLRLIPAGSWPAVPPEFGLAITRTAELPEGFAPVTNIGRWRLLRRLTLGEN